MVGHPALAQLIAHLHTEDLRREATEERLARSFVPEPPRRVSLKMGSYRFTVAKEVRDVHCAV